MIMKYEDIYKHVTEDVGFRRHAYVSLSQSLLLSEGVYFALQDEQFQREVFFAYLNFIDGVDANGEPTTADSISFTSTFGEVRIFFDDVRKNTTIFFPFEN